MPSWAQGTPGVNGSQRFMHVEIAEGIARGASTAPWRAIRGLKATEGVDLGGCAATPVCAD